MYKNYVFKSILQRHEGSNGKFKRLSSAGNSRQSTSDGYDGGYNAYEQIPKELLRDLKRSGNFQQLNDDSTKEW